MIDIMDFAYVISVVVFCVTICAGQDPTDTSFELNIKPAAAKHYWPTGNTRFLQCTYAIDGDQAPTLEWRKDGVKIVDGEKFTVEAIDNGMSLTASDIDNSMEGSYSCHGSLNNVDDSKQVVVELYKPLAILSEDKQFGLKGEDGEVKCEVEGKPTPSMQWKFENKTGIKNSEKYVIQPNTLLIKNLDLPDQQKYLCQVSQLEPFGTIKKFYIQYDVYEAPKVEFLTYEPNNPKVGDKMTFTCRANGVPAPTYSWKKADNNLDENLFDKINGILTFDKLSREDEAEYTCIATNKGGTDEKKNRLDVKIPPVIKPIDDAPNESEGGQKNLVCEAEGDPIPTIQWKKEGEQAYIEGSRGAEEPKPVVEDIIAESTAEVKIRKNTLKFDKIRPQDAGTYICEAQSLVGNATVKVKFGVTYKPNFNTDFKTTTFYGWQGHKANLTCLASGNPLANFNWHFTDPDDETKTTGGITNQGPYTVNTEQKWEDHMLTSSSLMVQIGEDREVYKKYTCEAYSNIGKAFQVVELVEALPPGRPTIEIKQTLSSAASLEVRVPGNNGGQPVTGYQYTYYPSKESTNKQTGTLERIPGAEHTQLLLRDLKPSTDYVVRVSARNNVGLGEEGGVSVITMDVSKPVQMTFTSGREGREPYRYTVEWEKADDGGSPITKFIINYRKVQVTGSKAEEWQIVPGSRDTQFQVEEIANANAQRFVLKNLDKDTHYQIKVTAQNKEGESDPVEMIIKTSKGASGVGDGGGANSLAAGVTTLLLFFVTACLSTFW